jgi:hypothetical protein
MISGNVDWRAGSPPATLSFTEFTVASGAVLTVPSGLVLRVTGAFANYGTILVSPWGGAGVLGFQDEPVAGVAGATVLVPIRIREAGLGIAADRATGGSYGRASGSVAGLGGFAIRDRLTARQLTRPGPQAGGAGGGAAFGVGGNGGGSLVILAQGSISNAGLIAARGEDVTSGSCGGGGGGGVLILASGDSIAQAVGGSLSVSGGTGRSAAAGLCAGGGGGGGGFVHLIAPAVTNSGAIDVAGGAGGAGSTTAPTGALGAGGGGGASGGNGGSGGTALLGVALPAGSSGNQGFTLTTFANPAHLM